MREEEWEVVQRAYYVERKSQRQIARELGMTRKRVKQIDPSSPCLGVSGRIVSISSEIATG